MFSFYHWVLPHQYKFLTLLFKEESFPSNKEMGENWEKEDGFLSECKSWTQIHLLIKK